MMTLVFLCPVPFTFGTVGFLPACRVPRAARRLQRQLFTLRVAQLDFPQPERVQPLRPLVVGQMGRHHREGFHASHQDRWPGRGQLLRAVPRLTKPRYYVLIHTNLVGIIDIVGY